MPTTHGFSSGAATYNNYVTIQQNIPTTNGDGQLVADWKQRFKVWARLITPRGSERIEHIQMRSEALIYLRVRSTHQSRLISAADHRVIWDLKILNIIACNDLDGMKVEVEMICKHLDQGPGT